MGGHGGTRGMDDRAWGGGAGSRCGGPLGSHVEQGSVARQRGGGTEHAGAGGGTRGRRRQRARSLIPTHRRLRALLTGRIGHMTVRPRALTHGQALMPPHGARHHRSSLNPSPMLPPTPLRHLSRPYNPPVLIFASSQASATPLAEEWKDFRGVRDAMLTELASCPAKHSRHPVKFFDR